MGALVTKQQKDKRFCFVLRYVILGKLIWVVILMMRMQYRRQFLKKYYTYINKKKIYIHYKWLEMALILAPESPNRKNFHHISVGKTVGLSLPIPIEGSQLLAVQG